MRRVSVVSCVRLKKERSARSDRVVCKLNVYQGKGPRSWYQEKYYCTN